MFPNHPQSANHRKLFALDCSTSKVPTSSQRLMWAGNNPHIWSHSVKFELSLSGFAIWGKKQNEPPHLQNVPPPDSAGTETAQNSSSSGPTNFCLVACQKLHLPQPWPFLRFQKEWGLVSDAALNFKMLGSVQRWKTKSGIIIPGQGIIFIILSFHGVPSSLNIRHSCWDKVSPYYWIQGSGNEIICNITPN